MRALILAAGQGTRLAPFTDDFPKCLVEIGGISLLRRQISVLRSQNIDDISVIAGHRAESLNSNEYRIILNPDYANSNMVHTLFCASHMMNDDHGLIVSYGDIVYEPNVLEKLLSCDSEICVAVDLEWRRYWELRMADPLADAETMKVDQNGFITELGLKPLGYHEIEGQYIGLIKIDRQYVNDFKALYRNLDPEGDYDGKNRKQMYMTSFLQHAINSGWRVRCVPISGGWLEIDTQFDLQLYRRMETEGTLGSLYNPSSTSVDVHKR